MLPSGAAGKSYIKEVTRLMKLWINDTLLRKIVCLHKYYRNHLNSQTSQNKKIIMLLSKEDKSYERKGKLKSCITKDKQYRNDWSHLIVVWQSAVITISDQSWWSAVITNNISNGISLLTDATLQLLKQNRPEFRQSLPEVLIEGPIRQIHSAVYDDINRSLILKAATLMKKDQNDLVLMQMDRTEF